MIIGDIIDSEIMQLIPLDFAKELVKSLFENDSEEIDEEENEFEEDISQMDYDSSNEDEKSEFQYEEESKFDDKAENKLKKKVEVKKFEFQNFDKSTNKKYDESIDLIRDIPIEITVELGRTTKKISEVLEYGPGTIIELDKLVGESLNIMANGKVIAKGEVVVIDDNFGVRVTDILSSSKKITKI